MPGGFQDMVVFGEEAGCEHPQSVTCACDAGPDDRVCRASRSYLLLWARTGCALGCRVV
ncbi:MAG: hypothetical protein ACJASC_003506 [Limimaricola cinnabarinus]|jgi:hypothetical protein